MSMNALFSGASIPPIAVGSLYIGSGTDIPTELTIGTNGKFLSSNGSTPLWSDIPATSWSSITGKPTFATVATSGLYSDLSGIPSTFTPSAHNQAWSTITSTPTTLSGYGISDAQPLDSDLTAIAALSTTSFGRSFLTQTDAASTRSTLSVLSSSEISAAYQPLDGDLTSIAGLAGTSGFLKKTGTNTWTLDTSTYITGSQIITYASTTSTASLALDLSNQQSLYLISALAANLTITTSNRTAGKVYGLRIKDNGTSRSLTFPSWTWMRPAPTSTVTSKWIIITIECYGTNDTDIIADWTTEDANVYTTYGKSLVTSADASAARTTLGLANAALTNVSNTFTVDQTINTNVGIGLTAVSTSRLSIKQSGDTSNPGFHLERSSNDSYFRFGYRSGTDSWQFNASFVSTGGYKPITFSTSDLVRMTVSVGGEIGIGIAPNTGDGLLQLNTGTTKANGIAFGSDSGIHRPFAGFISSEALGTANDAGYRALRSGGASLMMFSSTGAAFIGTDNSFPISFRSNNVDRMTLKTTGQFRFIPLLTDPAGAETGDVYYNATTNKLRVYNGAWVDLH